MTVNSRTPSPHSAPLVCAHPQDQGAFLCVVDDSNEHMLSVWDCSRGAKLAEIKVRSPGSLQGTEGWGAGLVVCRESRLTHTFTSFLAGSPGAGLPASLRL